jgi:hypothetical protein
MADEIMAETLPWNFHRGIARGQRQAVEGKYPGELSPQRLLPAAMARMGLHLAIQVKPLFEKKRRLKMS